MQNLLWQVFKGWHVGRPGETEPTKVNKNECSDIPDKFLGR